MKNFELTIRDGEKLLSELDLHQIENIVRLRLAPVRESVRSVDFQFSKNLRGKAKATFAAKISTELKSGQIVHVERVCDDQLESILLATDQMEKHVGIQIGLESRLPSKSSSFVKAFLDRRVVNLKLRMVTWLLAASEPLFWLFESKKGRNCENL